MPHAILILERGQYSGLRTWCYHNTVTSCMQQIFTLYEEHLSMPAPGAAKINIYDYIDELPHISCQVYQESTNRYEEFGKEWIKERIFMIRHPHSFV